MIAASVWHLGMRIGLRLLPFALLRDLSTRCMRPRALACDEATVADVLWSSRTVRRWLPGGGCLADAMATQGLLARRGHPTRLRVGVRRVGAGSLGAHAWLERHGEILVGGADSSDQFESVPLSSIG